MPTARLSLAIVLLLGILPGRAALAEYPFEPTPAGPSPARPAPNSGPPALPPLTGGQTSGGYNTVPYDEVVPGGGSYGDVVTDGGASGEIVPDAGPYSSDPFAPDAGLYGGGYGEIVTDDFANGGGSLFADPAPQESLFGFGDNVLWPGWVSGNITPGTDRVLYGGQVVVPLYQDGRTMWYFNFRGQGDDFSAGEFNTGTGVRSLTDPGWIFGAYAFWDHLRSSRGNRFNQGMVGFEAMSVLWDFRMNVYFPESGPESVGAPTATVANGNLVVRSGVERAYWGMDFEVGNLLWTWGPNAAHELRGFLALYHFDHSAPNTPSITGPRARLEYRQFDLPYFGPGSRFTAGLTVQADEVRDGQLFAFARLQLPLDPWAHQRKPLSPLHRRMLDPLVRDVDVVTATNRRSERAVNPHTGREIRGVARIDANTQNVGELLSELESDAVIVVDGSAGVINTTPGHQLKPGQTVIGAGSPFQVTGGRTGRKAMYNPGGERPTLDFGPTGVYFHAHNDNLTFDVAEPTYGLQMDDHTQLVGVDIRNAEVGIGVNGADDVLIKDVEVSDYSRTGIEISDSTNVRMDDVHVRDATQGPVFKDHPYQYPFGRGIIVRDSSDITIENSRIENAEMEGIFVRSSQDVTIRGTQIRDTPYDGIRLVNTKNVLIENVQIKNFGDATPDNMMGGVFTHELAGIRLWDTDETIIRDSQIHNSIAPGILGIEADNTQMSGLDIAHVEHGVGFDDSHNVSITGSRILLPDEAYRPYVPPEGGGIHLTIAGWVPQHAGVTYGNVTGEAIVEGNEILGGVAGGGVVFGAGKGTTNLQVRNNLIDRSGSYGIIVTSTLEHDLTATIEGNTVHSDEFAFFLQASGSGGSSPRQVTITDNEFNGEFGVRIFDDADLEMIVSGNHLGGDPIGRILAEPDTTLHLNYRNNTSTPGAGPMEFHNETPQFFSTLEGNDHDPQSEYAHTQ